MAVFHVVSGPSLAPQLAAQLAGLLAGAPGAVRVLLGVYGAVIGGSLASFLGVVGDRLPAGQGLGGRSHCACGRTLRPAELVPAAGWARLALRHQGKAPCCGTSVPARYGLSEAGLGAAAGLAAGFAGVGIVSAAVLAVGAVVVGVWHWHAGRRAASAGRGV